MNKMMVKARLTAICGSALTAGVLASALVFAHGNVQPQPVDTKGLESLGDEWRATNPYSGNATAIKIGKTAYDGNCARCHGLNAVSGGLSPDLRHIPPGAEGDEWYLAPTREGVIRNDVEYMPAFEGIISQEAMWAIRSWLETVYVEE